MDAPSNQFRSPPMNWADRGPKIRDSFIDPRILTVEEFTTWGGVVNYNNWDHERIAGRQKEPYQSQRSSVNCPLRQGSAETECGRSFLETPVRALEHESGCTSGVRIREGRAVRARKGVVLATGGWEGIPSWRASSRASPTRVLRFLEPSTAATAGGWHAQPAPPLR